MAGGKIMKRIILKDGLIYIDAVLTHGNKTFKIENALIDTGSSSTVISRDVAYKIGLRPEPTDIVNSVQGVGGSEIVIEKKIDSIKMDDICALDFCIQIGAMDYGIKLDAIIGLDFLMKCKVIMDLDNMVLKTVIGGKHE